MARTLVLNLLTSRSLKSADDGRRLLRLWTELLPHYVPERFGNYEPIRLEFTPDDIDSVVKYWDWPFLAKRRKPRMLGSVFMHIGKVPVHGSIKIELEWKAIYQVEIVRFFKEVSAQFEAEFGFLHLTRTNEYLGVTTHDLRKNIPDLYWATILGKAYVELFGRDRIKSCPASYIEELSNDQSYVQLSDDVIDVEKKPQEIFQATNLVKKHLNSNAFFDPELGPGHAYAIPQFNIQHHESQHT